MKMEIRKARKEDIDQIEAIYNRIHDVEEAGKASIGWARDIYPVRKTAEESLKRDDLFLLADEEIVAAAIINRVHVPEYRDAVWKYEAKNDEVMVLHTLVVNPGKSGKGYGKAFIRFYEEYAKSNQCRELRMDTNIINQRARKLYEKLGYEEVGVVSCEFNGISDVKLVCLEKYIGEQ